MGPWDYVPTGYWSQNNESRSRPSNIRRNGNNAGYNNQRNSNQRNTNQRNTNPRNSNQRNINQRNVNQRNPNQRNPNQRNMNHSNNNRQFPNDPNNMQQGGYDLAQLERIKQAIRENRIEFLDGGARIIDEPPTRNDSNLNKEEVAKETSVTTPETNDTLVEQTEDLDNKELYNYKLQDFIQSERNATIYYKYLASIADNEENSSILENLSNDSKRHFNDLNGIYENINGSKYEVKESKINDIINFRDGIAWAISLENKGLINMINYYENLDTDNTYKKINAIINRKTCYISVLHLMLYTTSKNNSVEQA